jgi:hypothetical protein
VRALSFLWALFIFGLALYELVFVDPTSVPYLGAEFSYWLVHDTAGASFHLLLLLLWLRPNFERRAATTFVFSLFMFVIYVLYMLTVALEMRAFGDGNCLSIITQVGGGGVLCLSTSLSLIVVAQTITYVGLPIVSYVTLLFETRCAAFSVLFFIVTSDPKKNDTLSRLDWRNVGRKPPKRLVSLRFPSSRRRGNDDDARRALLSDELEGADLESAIIDFTRISIRQVCPSLFRFRSF